MHLLRAYHHTKPDLNIHIQGQKVHLCFPTGKNSCYYRAVDNESDEIPHAQTSALADYVGERCELAAHHQATQRAL